MKEQTVKHGRLQDGGRQRVQDVAFEQRPEVKKQAM